MDAYIKKNELFPLLDDVINKIKNSPPCIKVTAKASHIESTVHLSTSKDVTKTYYRTINLLDINYSELNNEGMNLILNILQNVPKSIQKKLLL